MAHDDAGDAEQVDDDSEHLDAPEGAKGESEVGAFEGAVNAVEIEHEHARKVGDDGYIACDHCHAAVSRIGGDVIRQS